MSFQRIEVIGHLGKDCTVNQVNGKQVINFNVAHSTSYTDAKGQQVDKTQWFECAYWSDSKVSQFLNKGTQVFVAGEVEVRQWESNGKSGVSLAIRVFQVVLVGAKVDSTGPGAAAAPTNYAARVPSAVNITEPIDDLPF